MKANLVMELMQKRSLIRVEVEKQQEELERLAAGIDKNRRALQAIDELVVLETGSLPDESNGSETGGGDGRSGRRSRIADAAFAVLADAGNPLHYTELTQRVMRAGTVIGGRDPSANLLAHLSGDKRFRRTKRGTYALKDQNRGEAGGS